MNGSEMISRERKRQILNERRGPRDDMQYKDEELLRAAICYAMSSLDDDRGASVDLAEFWPFGHKWWKPRSREENLVRAGALIAAELDRMRNVAEMQRELHS